MSMELTVILCYMKQETRLYNYRAMQNIIYMNYKPKGQLISADN